MKMYRKLVTTILAMMTFFTVISMPALAANDMPMKDAFPPADGVDLGAGNQTNDEDSRAFWYSSYDYNSSSFKVGVYLNNGEPFACRSSRNPYLEKAYHSKVSNTDPSVYRVSYQMIYSSSGEVRKGVSFNGAIEGLKVYFDVEETNDFLFYISGDGSNTYKASGTLRY